MLALQEAPVQTLPDGVWFRIYSFLHRHHDPILLGRVDNDSLAVGDLFQVLASVSRDHNRRLFRYLQLVPQDFTYSYYELSTFAWACKHKMKLGGVVSFTSIGRIALNLYMHMIRSCNIYDMHTLTLNLQHVSSHVSHHFRTSAMENNIPKEVLQAPMSPVDFQQQYVEYIKEHLGVRMPSLKKLHLRIQKDEFNALFLKTFSQSLEELSLHILERDDIAKNKSHDHDLEKISEAIACLPKLKKLRICADLQASFRIRSASLEEINTIDSAFGFWVKECICPSLNLFKSRYQFPSGPNAVANGNGATPEFPCYRGAVKGRFLGKRLNDLQVCAGSHPFVGMKVPSSCVILLTHHAF